MVVDEDIPNVAVPKIFADNAQGGKFAGEHLLQVGHRKLAFIGGQIGMLSTTERLAGFRRAIALQPDGMVVQELYCDYSAAAGRAAADALIDQSDATAVFITSELVALGVLERLRERNVAVPLDLSLVTFDDVGSLHLFAPPLTAIRQPVADMAARAVALLMAHIAGTTSPDQQPVRLPVELVSRGSVAPPRVKNLARSATPKERALA